MSTVTATRRARKAWVWVRRVAATLGALVAVATAVLLWPDSRSHYIAHANPAVDYAEAVQRADALRAAETGFNPDCRVTLLTHGHKTPKAIVLVHGYTNCPAQFKALGEQFFDLGYNVMIAPLPYHGLADRMTEAHARLRAEDLVHYGDAVVDIGRGLGEHLTLAGHSAGGLVTGWAAQQRADIDQAVLISPGFGFAAIPRALTPAAVRAYQFLPNSFMWWDPSQQERIQPYHSYPRISTHALANILRLGVATQALARQRAPPARSILVITNGNDQEIDNDATAMVVALWRDHGASVETFEFPAGLHLDHDLIDPQHPKQNVAAVYPRLIELIVQ